MSAPLVRNEVVENLIREFLSAAESSGANMLETEQAAKAVGHSCAEAVRDAVSRWADEIIPGEGRE